MGAALRYSPSYWLIVRKCFICKGTPQWAGYDDDELMYACDRHVWQLTDMAPIIETFIRYRMTA